MDYKIWEINGFSLELDLADIDVMERYENAFESMLEEKENIPEDAKPSQQARTTCEIIRRFFETIFGKDAADKIFDGVKLNQIDYLNLLADFVDFASAQRAEISQKIEERTAKYVPNRQQRQHKK